MITTKLYIIIKGKDLDMKTIFKEKNPPKKREDFLKKSLLEAQRSLENAYIGLANVNDPDLIDSYIYELNAACLRYQVLLREVKSLTSAEVHQRPQISLTSHCPTCDSVPSCHSGPLPVSDIFEP